MIDNIYFKVEFQSHNKWETDGSQHLLLIQCVFHLFLLDHLVGVQPNKLELRFESFLKLWTKIKYLLFFENFHGVKLLVPFMLNEYDATKITRG